MALDTREKRASAVHVALPWRGLWPLPDGTVGQADRQHAAFLYSGISAQVGGGGPPLDAADEVRLSYMNIMSPWRGLLPLPALSAFDAADQAQFLFLSRDAFTLPAGGGEGGGGLLIGPNPFVWV